MLTEKQAWQYIADNMVWSPMRIISYTGIEYEFTFNLYINKDYARCDSLCKAIFFLYRNYMIGPKIKLNMDKAASVFKNKNTDKKYPMYATLVPIDVAFDIRRNFCLQRVKELS